jgi:ABC-type sugar transport system permease subunit
MKNKYVRITISLIAIVIVGVVAGTLRLRAIDQLPVDYDEDDYLRAAQQYAGLMRTGDWVGFTETNYRPEHPPLAKIIFGVSILPVPEQPLIPDRSTITRPDQSLPYDQLIYARLTSGIFGTIASILLAIINPMAGFFLAIHSFTIKYTSQVMLEALPALTSLVTVLGYVQYKRKNDTALKSRNFNGWLMLSAVFLGFTAASKYLYCVVGVAILIDWLLLARKGSGLKRWLPQIILWAAISIFVFFLADPYLWPAPFERLKESILYHAAYTTGAQEVQSAQFPTWQPLVWLAQSVPWNREVFIFGIDLLISILGIIGFSRMWAKERVYGLWLGAAIFFLLIWPTKWAQYILILTVPLSYAAAEGLGRLVIEPIKSAWGNRKVKHEKVHLSWRESIQSVPWLLPGIITIGVLILFPLIYQLAMAMTDFSGLSIRDGIQGGIWREVWLGISGQVKAISPFSEAFGSSTSVHYAGPSLITDIFKYGGGGAFLVFEIIWTVLSVGLQAVFGISLALLLNRRGVRWVNFWRTIFVLPWAIPEFVGALFWLRTFDPTVGWVAQAAGTAGGGGGAMMVSNLLRTAGPDLALLLMLIAATWIGFPFIMLAASASLKLIPYDVYDAAAIDGASGWPVFRFITWPLLLPLVVPVLIIRAIFAFNQFYLFFVFAPIINYEGFGTFAYISYSVFRYGNNYSISAGINVITVVVLIILLMLFNRWGKAAEGVTYAS